MIAERLCSFFQCDEAAGLLLHPKIIMILSLGNPTNKAY